MILRKKISEPSEIALFCLNFLIKVCHIIHVTFVEYVPKILGSIDAKMTEISQEIFTFVSNLTFFADISVFTRAMTYSFGIMIEIMY